MEQKSMGAFIAKLRKEQRMTQAELAEKLGVSDKAVSRWERNESAPDISLLLTIADIFSITADELLKGEKDKKATELFNKEISPPPDIKLLQYYIYSFAFASIASLALLAALDARFNFIFGKFSFIISCIFYLVAFIGETIFAANTFSVAKSNKSKKSLFRIFSATISFIILMGISAVPLIRFRNFDAWLLHASLLLIAAILICYIISKGLLLLLAKKEILTLSKTEKSKQIISVKCASIVIALLIITGATQFIFNNVLDEHHLVKGTTFYDYSSFVNYMEKYNPHSGLTYYEKKYPESTWNVNIVTETDAYGRFHDEIYDENGKLIAEGAGYKTVLTDKTGKFLCEYIRRNSDFRYIEYGKADDLLPITVYTEQDWLDAGKLLRKINYGYGLLYFVEIGLCFIINVTLQRKRSMNTLKNKLFLKAAAIGVFQGLVYLILTHYLLSVYSQYLSSADEILIGIASAIFSATAYCALLFKEEHPIMLFLFGITASLVSLTLVFAYNMCFPYRLFPLKANAADGLVIVLLTPIFIGISIISKAICLIITLVHRANQIS